MSPGGRASSILYEDASQSVFLLDIPSSIALAQRLSPAQHPPGHTDPLTGETTKKPCLLSSPPLKTPYSSFTEPKTESARAKVLQRIPPTEQAFHADIIEPLVQRGLQDIHNAYRDGQWCLPRHCIPDEQSQSPDQVQAGKEIPSSWNNHESTAQCDTESASNQPPVILSPSCMNWFESIDELRDQTVMNSSPAHATLGVGEISRYRFTVPPLASFVLCTLPTETAQTSQPSVPIPGLGDRRFNLVLLDPPWPNRSVRRGRQYRTNPYFDMDGLTRRIGKILRLHLYVNESIAAIWVTNAERSRKSAYCAIQSAGLCVSEEWVWIKTTTEGEPVSPVDGIWRKPYEILVIGRRPADRVNSPVDKITRRVIAAVPDVHSRKPNLRQVFERLFFASASPSGGSTGMPYSALEVFARNLTAGWWACGDEVLKFNADDWWIQPGAS